MRGLFRTYWNLSYLLEELWKVLMEKKWGGSRRKRFCSKMWENSVWGGPCENPVGLPMCDGPMETVEYNWVNICVCLTGFCHKTAEMDSLCII